MGSVDLHFTHSVGSPVVIAKAIVHIFLLVFKDPYHPNNMISQLLSLVGCWRKYLAVVLNLLTSSIVVLVAHF